ncbi:MAG: YCF48-related protein, partial [Xanthomonadales bacterium]
CLFLGTVLAGCEAPLDLAGVESQLSQSTQRSDLFQAVTRHQDTVIAVGGMGAILQSLDGGNNWQRTTLPGKPFLVDVSVCPDGRFYALDKTDGIWSIQPDGNWFRQALPEMTEPQAMTCDAANIIWVIGSFSTILHSVDAGASWDTWSLDEDIYLTTIQFVDRQHGFVSGEFGTVLLSADGGNSWNRAADLPDSFYPQSAYFTSPTTGWIVGLNGTIWKTDDGGHAWLRIPSGINTPLYGISGFGDTLLAVGDNSTILYHRVGDASWTLLDDATKSRTYLRGVASLGDGRFIAAGGGGALFTITIPNSGALTTLETLDE